MKKCIFCDWEEIKDDVIYETKDFFVKVGLGLVSAGHVMIIPKKHCVCFGELPEELEGEYNKLKKLLFSKIKEKFAEPFLIEYGIWGQSIGHAHIHFIPLESSEYKVESFIKELVEDNQIPFEVIVFHKLKDIYKKEKSYVYIEEKGKGYLIRVGRLKSVGKQKVLWDCRQFFAGKGGSGAWDWQKMSGEEKKLDEEKRGKTKEVLGKALKEGGGAILL